MKQKTLKQIIFSSALLFVLFACGNTNELPPLNEGYNTTYIMPEASLLTDEDRELIESQEKEYEQNADK